jgi:hypothetical protein
VSCPLLLDVKQSSKYTMFFRLPLQKDQVEWSDDKKQQQSDKPPDIYLHNLGANLYQN